MLIRLLSFLAFFFNFHVSFFVLFWKLQGYIVLNRPWAFVQWLQQADIKEEYGLFLHTIFKIFCLYESFYAPPYAISLLCSYILMAEPDHIIVKPIPNLSVGNHGAAFPFFYIEPKKYESVLRKFFPVEKGPITNIDPIGNSPVIVGKVFSWILASNEVVSAFSFLTFHGLLMLILGK